MTFLWIALALAGIYLATVWLRADAVSMRSIMQRDVQRMSRLVGGIEVTPVDDELFELHGRRRVQQTYEPPPTQQRPRRNRTRTGYGRRTNPKAPCWTCGMPMTPGHRHD